MKLYGYLILLLFFPFLTIAQEGTVEELKAELQHSVELLKKEQEKNTYLKEALDLRSEGMEASQGEITIRVNKVIGNMEENKIYVQGIVTYNGEERQNLQFQSHQLIAPNGNQYAAHSSGLPNDQNRTFSVRNAEAGIPYGFSIQFKDVKEKIPTLSLLRLALYGDVGDGIAFNFKGLDVNWD